MQGTLPSYERVAGAEAVVPGRRGLAQHAEVGEQVPEARDSPVGHAGRQWGAGLRQLTGLHARQCSGA